MMNDEMNIHDEFEDWLKQSADKHRMYPSDKLWRNINEQLHEQPNWPALTFGAVLTMALITATLVFLHPTKNVFTAPNYAYNYTSSSSVKTSTVISSGTEYFKKLKPTKQKEPVYAFNNPVSDLEPVTISTQQEFIESSNATYTGARTETNYTSPLVTLPSSTKIATNTLLTLKSSAEISPATADNLLAIKSVERVKETDSVNTDSAKELLANNSGAQKIQLPQVNKKRWHVEVYGGSNISYRRLSESMLNNHSAASQPLAADRGNLNSFVSQKPSVGINVGAAFVYAISDRVRVKAGVQVNFRQYNIDAYKSSFERSVLLLNNGFYYPDSVYTYSAISNAQGKAIALTNRYYQIGVPIGLEWTAVKLPNLHFNLAANLQPTYQINSNNYLLTSDYKSYVQAPSLLRRININAGVEATANFNAGNLQWQVGPQILYQTMPTQKANYSIHEHLIDYGVRVGIIKKL